MTGRIKSSLRFALGASLVLTLGACEGGIGDFGGMFGGSDRSAQAAETLPPPAPDERGVVTYANYQVMIAREGDTIPDMAGRVGLTPEEIARHNGLPVAYRPRAGEVLALPRDVGGTPVTGVWSTEIAAQAIDSAPGTAAVPADNPFNNGQQGTVIDPIRHRVQPGETAFSIARQYGVSATALASWNGLDGNMTVRENQELLIPVFNASPQAATAAPVPGQAAVAAANPPGSATPVSPPPSAAQPLPENQDVRDAQPPASPNLAEEASPPPAAPAAPSARFLMPVAGGSVLRGYAPNGANRNEGVDLKAPAGAPVRAAEDGEIALISESVGGLGTIVLIRHGDNLITVYGRISGVTLKKGDRVTRGQTIGEVAAGSNPNLHFEVRQGTASVDPAPYLGL